MPSYCVNKQAQANGDHEVHDLTRIVLVVPQFLMKSKEAVYENRRRSSLFGTSSTRKSAPAAPRCFWRVERALCL